MNVLKPNNKIFNMIDAILIILSNNKRRLTRSKMLRKA